MKDAFCKFPKSQYQNLIDTIIIFVNEVSFKMALKVPEVREKPKALVQEEQKEAQENVNDSEDVQMEDI